MGRPPIAPDRRDINFSVKLPPGDMAFLDEFKDVLGHVAMADAVRDMVTAFRTTFSLPVYQAERIQADIQARGLNPFQYIQELLAHRYEELPREESTPPKAPRK